MQARRGTRIGLLIIVLLWLWGLAPPPQLMAQDELHILQNWMRYTDAPNALYRHLSRQAFALLDQRQDDVARLQTAEAWRERQQQLRHVLHDLVGPFPARTPLRARVVDRLEKDGFRVEKLLYESMPGFYVTAAVFVPDGLPGPAPAVIYCSGHAAEAFRSSTYQRVILNLVKKGVVVLAFDPVGQGERMQYFDPQTGASRIGGPTKEHSYPGAQIFINGGSPARYLIWDGIRAVDYLLTRPDVDPDRIGITGRSGGGTQAAYIAAFDERIRAAAPENYITSFRRLLESIGPQDAEQNLYHDLARGLDHADFLAVRAPKPALLIATTRDFFSIQGARETFREVQRVYEAFGKPDGIQMVEDDAPHASTQKNREAMYRFFQQALEVPGSPLEEDVDLLDPKELQVTDTGQVATSLESETLFTLNRAKAGTLAERLEAARRQGQARREVVLREARTLSGYVPPDEGGEVVFTGRHRREDYAVAQYFIEGEGEYAIPFLLMIPDGDGPHPAVIYLHPEGKAAEAAPGGAMEMLVKQGYVVLGPDLIGTGEMGPGAFKGDAYDFGVGRGAYNIWFAAIQIGRSLVGLRAADVVRTVQFLRQRSDIDPDRIAAVAHGTMGPVLLHAAAFEPSIEQVALLEPLLSYQSLVMNRYYRPDFIQAVVPGTLTTYDLPDLAASLAPRPLLMVDVVDENGHPSETARVQQTYAVAHKAYADLGRQAVLRIQRRPPDQTAAELVLLVLKGQ